jgi:hypothetical protein
MFVRKVGSAIPFLEIIYTYDDMFASGGEASTLFRSWGCWNGANRRTVRTLFD